MSATTTLVLVAGTPPESSWMLVPPARPAVLRNEPLTSFSTVVVAAHSKKAWVGLAVSQWRTSRTTSSVEVVAL